MQLGTQKIITMFNFFITFDHALFKEIRKICIKSDAGRWHVLITTKDEGKQKLRIRSLLCEMEYTL